MNYIIIKDFYGRLGNNIIQLVNAIQTARTNNYNIVKICKSHKYINTYEIIVSNEIFDKKDNLLDYDTNFYDYAMRDKVYIDTKIFIEIFDMYIKPILTLKLDMNSTYEFSLHLRGGDSKFHNLYVPVPLYFVNKIYQKGLILVCEDMTLSVARYLQKNNMVIWNRNTIDKDLSILSNSIKLALGYGTFALLALVLNRKFKKLYLPDYVYQDFKNRWKFDAKEYLKDDQELIIIDLPNYIKVGQNKWTPTLDKYVLEYDVT